MLCNFLLFCTKFSKNEQLFAYFAHVLSSLYFKEKIPSNKILFLKYAMWLGVTQKIPCFPWEKKTSSVFAIKSAWMMRNYVINLAYFFGFSVFEHTYPLRTFCAYFAHICCLAPPLQTCCPCDPCLLPLFPQNNGNLDIFEHSSSSLPHHQGRIQSVCGRSTR